MSQSESPRATNTGASDQQNASPQRSTRKLTSTSTVSAAEKIIEATEQAYYLRTLAYLLTRLTYRGATSGGQLYYSLDGDTIGRRVHLTRTGLRPLVSPGTPNYRLDQLRLALIGHAAKLQIEMDDLLYGLAPGAARQNALNALVTSRTIDLIGRTTEDAEDADLHLATLQYHLGTGIARHPAGGAR